MISSFVICTKDRPLDLQSCVKSIVKQTILPYEVIIVDASSGDISIENQKNCESILDNKIKFVYIRSEPSTTRQRNIGVNSAIGDIVFFLDDDVILRQNYHEKMLEVYELKNDQNLGGVRGSYSNYNDESRKTTWLEGIFRKLFFMRRDLISGKSRTLPSLYPVEILKPDKIIEVEYMPTCICSYYRKILNEFKFDENLDRYALAEDWDLSYRVSRKYKLYQTPYALLFHKISPIMRIGNREFRKIQVLNLNYLAKKHLPPRSLNWLAYYWSLVGYVLFYAVKSALNFNCNELLGILNGIKSIMLKNDRYCHKRIRKDIR